MIKPPISLQDLRRKLYVKAKAEPSWRSWGLYVHVCKHETLYEGYRLAKAGLSDIHFHDIRAKSVTDAKRKYGRDFAQELAGHATGEMTDAYVRDNPNVDPLF